MGVVTKETMINALESTCGIVTTACQEAGISRTTHYNWMNSDEDYRKKVESIETVAFDFAESMLYGRMKAGDTTAIIFFLKCKGKGRGYIDRAIAPEAPAKEKRKTRTALRKVINT